MGIAFLVTCLSYSYFCIVCIIIACSRRNKYTTTTTGKISSSNLRHTEMTSHNNSVITHKTAIVCTV